ncbi:hypothetical protein HKCCE4037_16935 [Rhodobacterales bacterium HKCCE4037]|nr:hypothetical protein [Rhodobacterales bacterium HKCCE4037]
MLAGIALSTQPFWQPYLEALLERHLDLTINVPSNPWLGLATIVVGAIYHYLIHASTSGQISFRSADVRQHDSEVLRGLLDKHTFAQLRQTIARISTADSYRSSDFEVMDFWARNLRTQEGSFLDPKIAEKSDEMVSSLEALMEFLAYNFFVYPDWPGSQSEDTQYCLYPNHNMDRDGRSADDSGQIFYAEKQNELNILIRKALENVDDLVGILKRSLGSSFPLRTG